MSNGFRRRRLGSDGLAASIAGRRAHRRGRNGSRAGFGWVPHHFGHRDGPKPARAGAARTADTSKASMRRSRVCATSPLRQDSDDAIEHIRRPSHLLVGMVCASRTQLSRTILANGVAAGDPGRKLAQRRKRWRRPPQTVSSRTMLSPSSVKALFFDVFGTVVDWRTSVARESELVLEAEGLRARLARLRGCLARRVPARRWTRCATASFRSPSSTCCIGATSSASCRASTSPAWTSRRSRISTAPGTGSTAGRTRRPACSGCTRNS